MKRILKKMLVVILILLTINNFLMIPAHAVDALGSAVGGLFSGVVGILTITYRVPAVMLGWLINKFMTTLAFAEGYTDPSYAPTGGSIMDFLTIYDILFDRVKLISIDFFDIKDGDTSLVNQVRVNVAAWYYIMRNISAAILLVILIYIGIRMAVSTIASDRAIYKRMLVDWAVSLFLIFVLNYIIVFTISVNKAIVSALAVALNSTSGSTTTKLASVMGKFGWKGMNPFGGISSIVSAIIYIMLIWQTAALFFSYFNRMLKIAFLIIISPLISLTYSIDKIGDGKAQALEAWLKEFVFTILMQPFHCAIYLSLISTALNVLVGLGSFNKISETLGAAILSLVCITFTKEAEKIIRRIFAFKDDNKNTSLVAGAAVASIAMSKAKSAGSATIKGFNTAKNFIGDGRNTLRWTNLVAEGSAIKEYLSKDNSDGNGGTKKTFSEIKSEKRADAYEAQAKKWEEKYGTAKKIETQTQKDLNQIQNSQIFDQERAKLLANADGPVNQKEIEAIARFNEAKKLRDANAKIYQNPYASVKRKINKVRTTAKGAKMKVGGFVDKYVPFSEVGRLYAQEGKGGASLFTGAGVLGLKGSPSAAIATAIGTGRAVNEMSKGRIGNFKRGINEFAEKHSSISGAKETAAMTGEKSDFLSKISGDSISYDLDGDTVPNKLKDIISELQSAAKELGIDAPEENEIVNTIKDHKEAPDAAIASHLQKAEIESNGSSESNGEKLDRYEKAKAALMDYGIEYGINSKFKQAGESSVSSGSIISAIQEDDEIRYSSRIEAERTSSLKVAQKFLDGSKTNEIVEEMRRGEYTSDNPEKLGYLYEQLGKVINTSTKGKELLPDNMKQKLDEEAKELEKKRITLIGEAVKKINDENDREVENLKSKIVSDIEKLFNSGGYTKDLEELKHELEKISKQ